MHKIKYWFILFWIHFLGSLTWTLSMMGSYCIQHSVRDPWDQGASIIFMGNVNSGCICQELVEGPVSYMDRVPPPSLSPSPPLFLFHSPPPTPPHPPTTAPPHTPLSLSLSLSIYLTHTHTHARINMPERAHTLFRNYFAPISSPHLSIKLGEIGRLIKISSESLVWLFSRRDKTNYGTPEVRVKCCSLHFN